MTTTNAIEGLAELPAGAQGLLITERQRVVVRIPTYRDGKARVPQELRRAPLRPCRKTTHGRTKVELAPSVQVAQAKSLGNARQQAIAEALALCLETQVYADRKVTTDQDGNVTVEDGEVTTVRRRVTPGQRQKVEGLSDRADRDLRARLQLLKSKRVPSDYRRHVIANPPCSCNDVPEINRITRELWMKLLDEIDELYCCPNVAGWYESYEDVPVLHAHAGLISWKVEDIEAYAVLRWPELWQKCRRLREREIAWMPSIQPIKFIQFSSEKHVVHFVAYRRKGPDGLGPGFARTFSRNWLLPAPDTKIDDLSPLEGLDEALSILAESRQELRRDGVAEAYRSQQPSTTKKALGSLQALLPEGASLIEGEATILHGKDGYVYVEIPVAGLPDLREVQREGSGEGTQSQSSAEGVPSEARSLDEAHFDIITNKEAVHATIKEVTEAHDLRARGPPSSLSAAADGLRLAEDRLGDEAIPWSPSVRRTRERMSG